MHLKDGKHEVVDAPQGVSVRYVWRFEVVDASKVPVAFLGPDPAKIDVYLQTAKDQAKIAGRPVLQGAHRHVAQAEDLAFDVGLRVFEVW